MEMHMPHRTTDGVLCFALGWFSLPLVAATAHADPWIEASSDHFVIYSDQNEIGVRGFTERLERFHCAMAHVYGRKQDKPGPSNRVTVFVLSSQGEVREVTGTKNRFMAGVYMPRAGSSIALIPRVRGPSRYELSGETILYHEYAHHFMCGLTARAYPRWFSEGFAEFFAGAKFREDGSVLLGTPATHRTAELVYAREVPIRKFLDFDGGASEQKFSFDSFYGQSWIMFHYLQMAPERAGQFSKYRLQLANGHSALESAQTAFGDLDKLDKDVEYYMKRHRLSAMVIDAPYLQFGPITVRELRPGEAAMMPVMIESKAGVTREEAVKLVPDARKVALKYPDDAAVLAALSEAEFDAGNDDAAIAAADRAVAINPKLINAQIQKGYALAHKVESGALPKESWQDVRAQFIKANGIENDNPIPLVQFYLTFMKEGTQPSKNAIAGLEWAMELAPFDASLRWLVAQQMIADDRLQQAAQTLVPLAYSPHPGQHTDQARKLLQDVEARLAAAPPASPKPE
jgi:tetratricopeptide (TPR) repeat protein